MLDVRAKGASFETDIISDTTNLNHTILQLIENFGDGIECIKLTTIFFVIGCLKTDFILCFIQLDSSAGSLVWYKIWL